MRAAHETHLYGFDGDVYNFMERHKKVSGM